MENNVSEQISDADLRYMLDSDDTKIVEAGLSKISGASKPIGDATLEKASAYIANADPELRAAAILAVGLHCRHESAFPLILDVAKQETYDEALTAATSALTWYAENDEAKSTTVIPILAKIALDHRHSPRARAIANVGIRTLIFKLEGSTRASENANPEMVCIDESWLRKLLLEYEQS